MLEHAIPKLERSVEQSLIIKARSGCAESMDTLVRAHIPWAIRLVSRYSNKGMDSDDYTQLGMLGIMDAIWSCNLKYRLITHVTWRIRHRITEAQLHGELIRCPSKRAPKGLVDLFPLPRDFEQRINYDSLWFVTHLSRKFKRIIYLKYYLGWTLNQIGLELGVCRERVRQLLVMIKKQCREDHC